MTPLSHPWGPRGPDVTRTYRTGTSPYPVFHGAATVIRGSRDRDVRFVGPLPPRNVREAVRRMVTEANGPNDHIAFVDSSHGNGDGKGSSYPCMAAQFDT